MAAAVSFLGRGSSAPTLLKLPLVSPAVSPYASPERLRPGFDTCVHDPSWADRLQSERLRQSRHDKTPAAHLSLAALLSLCDASDRIDAFVEQGFTAAAHVVQDLNEDDLKSERLGLRLRSINMLRELLAAHRATAARRQPQLQLAYRGDFSPDCGNMELTIDQVKTVIVEELRRQAERAEVVTAGQIADVKDELTVLLRDEVLHRLSSLRSATSTMVETQHEMLQEQQKTHVILSELLQDSQNLVTLGKRTYRTLRSLAEGDAEVPRLMTVTPLDNSIWKGSWYENTGDNIASWLKDRAGVSCSFRLHFLCEKRLQPTPGHEDGYTVEMPTVAFRQFVSKAAPLLSVIRRIK